MKEKNFVCLSGYDENKIFIVANYKLKGLEPVATEICQVVKIWHRRLSESEIADEIQKEATNG